MVGSSGEMLTTRFGDQDPEQMIKKKRYFGKNAVEE